MSSKKTRTFTVSDSTSGEIRYTFDLPAARDSHSAQKDEWVMADLLEATPLYDGSVRVTNPRTGAAVTLPTEVYNALTWCDRFQTLEEHAERLGGANQGAEESGQIRAILHTARESGLMLSARDLADSLRPTQAPMPHEDPARVAILTWQRPEALSRLLESMQRNADPQLIDRCLVIDDSRDAEAMARNRDIAAATSGAPLAVDYVGAEEMKRFSERLCERLPDKTAAIEFLIDRERWSDYFTAGLSRNYSLLLSTCRRLVVFDDDALCEAFDPPVSQEGVAFEGSPRAARFFSSDEEWARLRSEEEPDPVRRHLSCLGLRVPEALFELGTGPLTQDSFAQADPELAGSLGSDNRVLVTQCGSLCDPGTGSNRWLIDLDVESLDDLLKSTDAFGLALDNRNCWLGRSRVTFEPEADISQLSGFDNRELLPPYFPIFRGSDRMFGAMTRLVHCRSLCLDMPWCIPHLPTPRRHWNDRDNSYELGSRFPDFLVEFLIHQTQTISRTQPEHRLSSLAECFDELGHLDDATLDRLQRDYFEMSCEGMRRRIAQLLNESIGRPPQWQRYLSNALKQVQQSSKTGGAPAGMPEHLEGSELFGFWRTQWQDFAGALRAWPEIREAAGEIELRTL